ncbi:MAG: MerR family DNA-binding protein [Gammaproteobacteria bacterium]
MFLEQEICWNRNRDTWGGKMRVSELATKLAINPDTVRYYTRIGLLSPRKNSTNGYKEFDGRDASRLNFILSARRLGFSIEDVKHILEVSDQNETPCPVVRNLIEQRLNETESRYQQLTLLRNRMREAVKLWQELPDRNPTGHMICHLIENFPGGVSSKD